MAVNLIFLVVAIASLVLGLILLLTSSLATDDATDPVDLCDNNPIARVSSKVCDDARLWLSACAFGIIAAIIQIVSMLAGWTKKVSIWCLLHLIILVLTVIAFGIAIHLDVFAKDSLLESQKGKDRIRKKAFASMCIIDAIFCIIGIPLVYMCSSQK